MKIAYIIFFLILNLLVFSFISGKIKIKNWLIISLVMFLIIFLIAHFTGYLKLSSEELFPVLLVFSFIPLLAYTLGKVSVWFALNTISSIRGHDSIKMFNFMIKYVFSSLATIFQIFTILQKG